MHANRQRCAFNWHACWNSSGQMRKISACQLRRQNVYPLTGALILIPGQKMELKPLSVGRLGSVIHTCFRLIDTQLMWKLMAADWHIWVAESRRRIWQPSRSGNPRGEACRVHITRQHKETASNRESAAISAPQSRRQREFDFETRRQAERQMRWQR